LNKEEIESLNIDDSVKRKLLNAEPHDAISINICLHAIQWVKLLEIREYKLNVKGDRRARSIAGTLFPIIDKAHQGMVAAKKRAEEGGSKEEPDVDPVAEFIEDNPVETDDPQETEDDEGEVSFHSTRPMKL